MSLQNCEMLSWENNLLIQSHISQISSLVLCQHQHCSSKLCLASGLCFPQSYSETSGFPRLSDSHFMMFYYRVRLSQASHYSINTVGTGSKMFLQKNRGSSSDKDFREMVLQKEANLGEKSLRISIAEPVGNCALKYIVLMKTGQRFVFQLFIIDR